MNDFEKYTGMTVNERLYAAGLADAFENAVHARDAEAVLKILRDVLAENQAVETADAVLKNPGAYGF